MLITAVVGEPGEFQDIFTTGVPPFITTCAEPLQSPKQVDWEITLAFALSSSGEIIWKSRTAPNPNSSLKNATIKRIAP